MFFSDRDDKSILPQPEQALPGRSQSLQPRHLHSILGTRLTPPFSDGSDIAVFGMGCFWGVERVFWQTEGVISTAVGYSGGFTPNPTYREVCSGGTAHNEVVQVVFDPARVSYQALLAIFWQNHNPTQGMRQGNDRGTQYRSAIYYHNATQKALAEESFQAYQRALDADLGLSITTEIEEASPFYYAEDDHQQYLAKNPEGYCNLQSIEKTGLPGIW